MKISIRTIIASLLGVAVGAAALYGVTIASGGAFPPGLGRPAAADAAEAHPRAGTLVPLRERIVNLADPGIFRYLKVSIVLEVFDPEHPRGHTNGEERKGKEELPKDLRPKAALIEDRINTLLSARTSQELMASAARQQLKDDIKRELNELLHEERVLAVYFTDFIIQ